MRTLRALEHIYIYLDSSLLALSAAIARLLVIQPCSMLLFSILKLLFWVPSQERRSGLSDLVVGNVIRRAAVKLIWIHGDLLYSGVLAPSLMVPGTLFLRRLRVAMSCQSVASQLGTRRPLMNWERAGRSVPLDREMRILQQNHQAIGTAGNHSDRFSLKCNITWILCAAKRSALGKI